MRVCVIPARGGSKRIPRKNIRNFHGRPMIAWSILAAKESGLFDLIVVSTDDNEIATVARDQGAQVPFMRPAALSDDYAATVQVIAHAVSTLGLDSLTPVCCLYATAPLVEPAALKAAFELLVPTVKYVMPVTTFAYPIQRALCLDSEGGVKMIAGEHMVTRSQDLQEAWHDAGQFYWALAGTWAAELPIFSQGARGFPLPRNRVQDIDTPEDWKQAEALFKVLRG